MSSRNETLKKLTRRLRRKQHIRKTIEGPAGNKKAAAVVGKAIAERVKSLGIERVQMDRNGYRFHGCIKALVEAARSAGLKI